MIRALTACLALAVAACAPPPTTPSDTPSLSSAACEARGGTMKPVGRMQTVQCVIAYADAGKPCTDGSQCQGDCRAEPAGAANEAAPVRGVCQAESNRFGCFTTIRNGRAEPTLCID